MNDLSLFIGTAQSTEHRLLAVRWKQTGIPEAVSALCLTLSSGDAYAVAVGSDWPTQRITVCVEELQRSYALVFLVIRTQGEYRLNSD
jgi:hypothetical protein